MILVYFSFFLFFVVHELRVTKITDKKCSGCTVKLYKGQVQSILPFFFEITNYSDLLLRISANKSSGVFPFFFHSTRSDKTGGSMLSVYAYKQCVEEKKHDEN